jgi:hypothetical protein
MSRSPLWLLPLALLGCTSDRAPSSPPSGSLPTAALFPAAGDGEFLLVLSITSTSSPNPLIAGHVFDGARSEGARARFRRGDGTVDLQVIEASGTTRTVASWPARETDGWISVRPTAALAMRELSPLADEVISRCAHAATAVGEGTLSHDPKTGTLTVRHQLEAFVDPTHGGCEAMLRSTGREPTATVLRLELTTSLVSASALPPVPATLSVPTDDGIRRSYGWLERSSFQGPRVLRLDPTRSHRFVMSSLSPRLRDEITRPGGLAEATNRALANAGSTARVAFEDEVPGTPPDGATSTIRLARDLDEGLWQQVAVQHVTDPATGGVVAVHVQLDDAMLRTTAAPRLDGFLAATGAAWPTSPCVAGTRASLVDPALVERHGGTSALYRAMQADYGKPIEQVGARGPHELSPALDPAARAAFPAFLRALPAAEPGTPPRWDDGGAATTVLADIGRGSYPSATAPLLALSRLLGELYALQSTSLRSTLLAQYPGRVIDPPEAFSFESILGSASVQCAADGTWETREAFLERFSGDALAGSLWHAMGHALGLADNFAGSLDSAHFDEGAASSSIMDHDVAPDGDGPSGFGPYDRAALSFLYGNAGAASGSWSDPLADAAHPYLQCNPTDERRWAPCRAGDRGADPVTIVANDVARLELDHAAHVAGTWELTHPGRAYIAVQTDRLFASRRLLAMRSATGLAAPIAAALSDAARLRDAAVLGTLRSSPTARPGSEIDRALALGNTLFIATWGVPAVDVWQVPCDRASFDEEDARLCMAMMIADFDAPAWLGMIASAGTFLTTRSTVFEGSPGVRDWNGAYYFHGPAETAAFFKELGVSQGACTTVDTCPLDVEPYVASHSVFTAPDGGTWRFFVFPSGEELAATAQRSPATFAMIEYLDAHPWSPGKPDGGRAEATWRVLDWIRDGGANQQTTGY